MASAIGGAYEAPLQWLSRAELFAFRGHDNLTLQAYAMKGANAELPVLVYCAGWTETTVKYAPFLQDLSERAGYSIFSFDFRGQGFSETTMDDGGRVTHIATFREYTADLRAFTEFVKERYAATRRVLYVGNSLSGLVGLSTEAQWPGTFARLAVAAPVIKPLATLNSVLRNALYGINKLGYGKVLPTRLGSDITGLNLTHNEALFIGWQKMRAIAPRQLIVQGPSISWLSELTEQGHALLKQAGRRPSGLDAPLLVLVADSDLFVDNDSIFELARRYEGSIRVVKLSGSWHELWTEREDIYAAIRAELLRFLEMQ